MHSCHHVVINLTPGQAQICCYFTLQLEAFPWKPFLVSRQCLAYSWVGMNKKQQLVYGHYGMQTLAKRGGDPS